MYNQFNPYQMPGTGLSAFKRVNWSNILNNTQKTLNVINQAIPIIYQVKPLVSNARTLFRIADAVKDSEPSIREKATNQEEKSNLQFFL